MRNWQRRVALAASLSFAGCAGGSIFQDELLGFEGLNLQLRNYYDRNAWERQATCPTPEMQAVMQAEVVEQREEQLVVRVRYAWSDPGQTNDDTFFMGAGVGCQGIGERLFTLRAEGDRATILSMTGAQRPPTTQPGRGQVTAG